MTQFLGTFLIMGVSLLLGRLIKIPIVSYFKIKMIRSNFNTVMEAQLFSTIIVFFGLLYLAEFERPTTGVIGGTLGIFFVVRSWILKEMGMELWEIDHLGDEEEVEKKEEIEEKEDQEAKEENHSWESTFEQIILLVNKYHDKGASASYTEENSLEVKTGNPPEYLIKVYIYDHPSSGIVLRSRFSRPDEGAVVKLGDEGIPMLTLDYESPEKAKKTLFGHLETYLEANSPN